MSNSLRIEELNDRYRRTQTPTSRTRHTNSQTVVNIYGSPSTGRGPDRQTIANMLYERRRHMKQDVLTTVATVTSVISLFLGQAANEDGTGAPAPESLDWADSTQVECDDVVREARSDVRRDLNDGVPLDIVVAQVEKQFYATENESSACPTWSQSLDDLLD